MKERILTKNFVFTFMAQLCIALCAYTLMSTMTEHVTSLGATASMGGLITGLYVFGGLFSRIYSGIGLEKYGWKRIGLVFGMIYLIACALYAFAPNIPVLILIRFMHGIGSGATMNAIMISGVAGLPKSRYGEAIGYFMMSTSLGVAIGPFVGGLIYDRFGGNGCFFISTIFSLLIVVFFALTDLRDLDPWYKTHGKNKTSENSISHSEPAALNDPSEKKKTKKISDLVELKAVPISLVILFLCFSYAALMSFYRLYSQYTGLERQFRSFFLIYAAMLVLSRPVAGKIQDRFGDNAVCYPCIILQALGIFLVSWKPCMLTIIICALLGALGYGTMNSVLNVIVNRNSTDERRSYAMSTYWAFSDIGLGIAPAILGMIATATNYRVLFFAATFISFLALPIYFLVWGKNGGKNNGSSN